MKSISLKLPAALHAKLTRTARQRGQTQSELLRTALEEFLNGHRARSVTVADLAGDLLGTAEGAQDLSTNTCYLDGYGK